MSVGISNWLGPSAIHVLMVPKGLRVADKPLPEDHSQGVGHDLGTDSRPLGIEPVWNHAWFGIALSSPIAGASEDSFPIEASFLVVLIEWNNDHRARDFIRFRITCYLKAAGCFQSAG